MPQFFLQLLKNKATNRKKFTSNMPIRILKEVVACLK